MLEYKFHEGRDLIVLVHTQNSEQNLAQTKTTVNIQWMNEQFPPPSLNPGGGRQSKNVWEEVGQCWWRFENQTQPLPQRAELHLNRGEQRDFKLHLRREFWFKLFSTC